MSNLKLIFATILVSQLAVASDKEVDQMALQMTGFSIVENAKEYVKIQFREQVPMVISKNRFSSSAEASKFCSGKKLVLQEERVLETIMLIAMTGASNVNSFLNEAISFEVKKDNKVIESGIWAWAGNSEKVVMLYNGRGTDTEVVPVSQIAAVGEKLGQKDLAKLPALCE